MQIAIILVFAKIATLPDHIKISRSEVMQTSIRLSLLWNLDKLLKRMLSAMAAGRCLSKMLDLSVTIALTLTSVRNVTITTL